MGSELRNSVTNDRVWPPSLISLVRKNVEVETLLDEQLEATRPITSVTPFFPVYRSILRDIESCGYTIDGSERRFIPFAYDWRKSNDISAQALSDHLNAQESFDEIVLIGHSMGGLVLRYMLESGNFDEQPWFTKVTQLITMGTPHLGASAALKQITGKASNLGLSADSVKRLVSDSRYPSAYQLVPQSGSAMTLRSASRERLPVAIDPFGDSIVQRFDLEPSNIESARVFWSSINLANKPEQVRYFSFVGSAHKTINRLEWTGSDLIEREASDAGDGTVPIASSLNSFVAHSFSQKKHATIFADRNLRKELFKMLGAPAEVFPHSLADGVSAQLVDPAMMGFSTDREDYQSNDEMEIVVSFTQVQTNPRCRFQIAKIDPESENGDVLEMIGEPIDARFDGAQLQNFKFSMAIDLTPGVYELQCANQVDDPERNFFVVSE